MEFIDMIAQGIGIFAMVFNIFSYQQKNQKTVILFQLFGGMLFGIHYWMLGATVGALMNVIAVIRAIVFIFKEKLHADHIAWTVGFITVFLVSYVLTFTVFGKEPTPLNFVFEFLPVIGMTALTIGFRCRDAKAIRQFGLISSPSWLIYNIVNFSIGAICCEVISLISILIGMMRLDSKKAQKKHCVTQNTEGNGEQL